VLECLQRVMAELFGRRLAAVKGAAALCTCSAEHRLLGGYAFVAEGIPLPLVPLQNKYRREALKDESADQVTACFRRRRCQ